MMKNFTKMAALAVMMFGFALTSNAQSSATNSATASATIVAPIAIAAGTELKFGNIVKSAAGGTVTVAPDDTRSASGVSFSSAFTGSPAASSFAVTGEGSYTYAITLPSAAVTLTGISGAAVVAPAATMNVTSFVSTPNGTGTLTSGAQTVKVGGTITVAPTQASGGYSGTYSVTVAYN